MWPPSVLHPSWSNQTKRLVDCGRGFDARLVNMTEPGIDASSGMLMVMAEWPLLVAWMMAGFWRCSRGVRLGSKGVSENS